MHWGLTSALCHLIPNEAVGSCPCLLASGLRLPPLDPGARWTYEIKYLTHP